MTISAVNSGREYVSQVQPQPQTHAERVAEKENDRVRDDGSKVAAVQSVPSPTVNTQGQTVGVIVNVKA